MQSSKGSLLLLLTSFIWGTSFVAQSAGMEFVEPFTYNGIRTLLGGIVLIPLIFFLKSSGFGQAGNISLKNTVKGGILCGIVLFVASSLQQSGMTMTTAGKAGFITALYIIIVPLIEFILYKRASKKLWLCVFIALSGFYFLCIKDDTGISKGDLLVLICAVFFAVHIMVIDSFNGKKTDGMIMSCIQFFVAGTLMLICMFIFEKPNVNSIWDAKLTILYGGIMSSGIAYTLQIIGQKYTPPAIATLLMSLESVFAVLSGWVILHEKLSGRELFGCILVFAAVIAAQTDISKIFKRKENVTV